ncbi:MAG TPA: hypothetical protein VF599_01545 [Pyrinomonadaceae bacterium]|jgi:hypothetical protein
MDWKEKINELALKGLISYGTENELQDFISTEIIEKLIAEIPDEGGGSLVSIKQQLRDKWL